MSDAIVNRIWIFCPVYFDVDAFLVLRAKLVRTVDALSLVSRPLRGRR